MAALFADTSGWGSIASPTEPFHVLAASVYRHARGQKRPIITTNYVVAELVALMTSPLRISRAGIVAFVTGLKASPFVEIVHVDAVLDHEGWQLFQARQDKDWSLVDCTSFIVMKKQGIAEALTADHHFEQAGFVRLLK